MENQNQNKVSKQSLSLKIRNCVRKMIKMRNISEMFFEGDQYRYLLKNLRTDIVKKGYDPYEEYLGFNETI